MWKEELKGNASLDPKCFRGVFLRKKKNVSVVFAPFAMPKAKA